MDMNLEQIKILDNIVDKVIQKRITLKEIEEIKEEAERLKEETKQKNKMWDKKVKEFQIYDKETEKEVITFVNTFLTELKEKD